MQITSPVGILASVSGMTFSVDLIYLFNEPHIRFLLIFSSLYW